jgi:hypothetical protein
MCRKSPVLDPAVDRVPDYSEVLGNLFNGPPPLVASLIE